MENLLDVHQVAAIMRIHHKKVQRLARTGVLPCAKIGCVYRFDQEELKGWIKNEISKRKSTEARSELGVQVPGCPGDTEAENPLGVRISYSGFREGGPTESSFYLKRP